MKQAPCSKPAQAETTAIIKNMKKAKERRRFGVSLWLRSYDSNQS